MARAFAPSAPNYTLWILALLIGGLGILFHFIAVEGASRYSFEMLMIGFLLLVIGTAYRKI